MKVLLFVEIKSPYSMTRSKCCQNKKLFTMIDMNIDLPDTMSPVLAVLLLLIPGHCLPFYFSIR